MTKAFSLEGRAALVAHIENGTVAGVPLADLADQTARDRAYTALESAGLVPQAATDDEATAALAAHRLLPAKTAEYYWVIPARKSAHSMARFPSLVWAEQSPAQQYPAGPMEYLFKGAS